MDTTALIDRLSSLMKIDIDAIKVYEKVIEKIPEKETKVHLMKFKDDHVQHVESLEQTINDLGGKPPKRDVDLKGLFLTGKISVEQIFNSENALKALLSGEEVTNKAYDQSVTKELPAEIRSLLDVHNRDELDHIRYISNAINIRIWEQAA